MLIEPNDSLGSAIDSYAHLLSHPNPENPQDLRALAQQTIELNNLAQTVAHAVSPAIKNAADDLEKILKSPLSENISILVAAKHYLENPETAELKPLVEELCHNSFALELMRNELTLLASSVKKL
jgi:hypothetical protein